MFKRLTDLEYNRKATEAFGFYLAYLLLILIAGAIAEYLFGGLDSIHGFFAGVNIATVVAVISCITLSYLIFKRKKLTNSFSSLLLSLLSGFLAIIGWAFLGLVIPAIVTTVKAKGAKKRKR